MPAIRIHYLGHASFIISFDNGVHVLTDYGESRAYGLDSPIYDLDDFQPTIVTYSHHHPDHDRGAKFSHAQILAGENLVTEGITFQAIAVSENNLEDNYGYLITYQGITIFHAGDSQGDIACDDPETVHKRLSAQLPERLDLLLLPIGWTRDILSPAELYLASIQPGRVIPMHYWSEEEKRNFLAYLSKTGKNYKLTDRAGAAYDLFHSALQSEIEVISLTPAPFHGPASYSSVSA